MVRTEERASTPHLVKGNLSEIRKNTISDCGCGLECIRIICISISQQQIWCLVWHLGPWPVRNNCSICCPSEPYHESIVIKALKLQFCAQMCSHIIRKSNFVKTKWYCTQAPSEQLYQVAGLMQEKDVEWKTAPGVRCLLFVECLALNPPTPVPVS